MSPTEHAIVEYARQFTPPNKASRAVGRMKRAVQSGAEAGFLEGLAIERELQQLLFQSDDAREGIDVGNGELRAVVSQRGHELCRRQAPPAELEEVVIG